MTSIDDIIRCEDNPFNPATFKAGNFWQQEQDPALTVQSIHQDAIAEVEAFVNRIAKDNRSRTIVLSGESGSGKSYLLSRLKSTLNHKAFFAYIEPWSDSKYIKRHILRHTIDSLMQIPEYQQDSQLILWLKSMSAFKQLNLKGQILRDHLWIFLCSARQRFINYLKNTYRQAGIYNSDDFFGALHHLTTPEYPLACKWLRGDDLSEESLQILNIQHSINTEATAWATLSNLGRTSTQPIVLCFDNLDKIPRSPDGFPDYQALFKLNAAIHNEPLKNFLVIVNVITNDWKSNRSRIHPLDQIRIERVLTLKDILPEQAEALWASRLKPIHEQAETQLTPIFPLTRQALLEFSDCKTCPRNVLMLGSKLFDKYKERTINGDRVDKLLAAFELVWQDEYNKVKEKITRIRLLAATDLILMLQEALVALQLEEVKTKLLSGTFSSYSLSYRQPGQSKRVGVVWTEDTNMNSFLHAMNACQKVLDRNDCYTLYLIRAEYVGKPSFEGNKIYRKIFTNPQHYHIKPTLSSVHDLVTYHNLVNSARANELIIDNKIISLKELEELIGKTDILQDCLLLKDLGIASYRWRTRESNSDLPQVKNLLLNIVIKHKLLARKVLIANASNQFSQVNESQINKLIQELCQENKFKIVNPNAGIQEQLIRLVP